MNEEKAIKELHRLIDYFKIEKNDKIAITTQDSGHVYISELLEDISDVIRGERPLVY